MVTIFVLFRPRYPEGSVRLDGLLNLVGILVIITGQTIRALTIGLRYIERGGRNGHVYASSLVTEGLFRHCRNPLYVGNILVYFGLFIIFNNPIVYLVGISFILLVYTSIVAAEENYLLGKFGDDYANYCREVNRWIPDLRGIRKTISGMSFSWRRVLSKEYTSTYTWILGMVFLLMYEDYAYHTMYSEPLELSLLLAILMLGTVLWASVRHLKLTGRLKAE